MTKKDEEFVSAVAEAEKMFFSAVENSDEQAVDQCAASMMQIFSDEFHQYKNADVLLALCGFLVSFCDFIAEEANLDKRTAMMVLQVGMQRAQFATDCPEDHRTIN